MSYLLSTVHLEWCHEVECRRNPIDENTTEHLLHPRLYLAYSHPRKKWSGTMRPCKVAAMEQVTRLNGKLKWSAHCQNVASKATRVLNVLRRSMFGCDCEAKCRAYKAIVRPLLEYAYALIQRFLASIMTKGGRAYLIASIHPTTVTYDLFSDGA